MKRKALLVLMVGLLVGCGDYGWRDPTTIKLRNGSTMECDGGIAFIGDYVECHLVENARFAKHTIYLMEVLSMSRTQSTKR